jgi:hypothetical protein
MPVVGLLGLLALALVLSLATTPFAPVTRARLHRFALRQSLPITVENGAIVLRYLATTRRWRGGGLILAVVASVIWSTATGAHFTIAGTALFAGWFVGAIVAEWRVGLAVERSGTVRVALLQPRRLTDYLFWRITVILVGVSAGVFATEIVAIAVSAHDRLELVGVAVLSVAVAVVIVRVAGHVLTRPQPLQEAGVVQADDALRSRSLHVLAGSGIAISGYLLSITVAIASRDSAAWGTGALSAGTAIGILVLPILGVLVATARSGSRRRTAVAGVLA